MINTKGRKYNPNLVKLIETFHDKDKRIFFALGGSRSGKTWAIIDFLIYYATKVKGPKDVVIVRETLTSFDTTIANDFKRRLQDYGLDNPFLINKKVTSFKIFDVTIRFLGADNPSKLLGSTNDLVWVNEVSSVEEDIYLQLKMRTRNLMILDSNPVFSNHWSIRKVKTLPETEFLQTTWKDNPFITTSERTQIESYAPTKYNIDNGTHDPYYYNVYYLGKPYPRTGLIYPVVEWIDCMPTDTEYTAFGLDFGMKTHPTVLATATVKDNNLYSECLFYTPTPTVDLIHELIIKTIIPYTDRGIYPQIWADSANPLEITQLQHMGENIYDINAVYKYNGSVLGGIRLINSYKIHLVKNKFVENEQQAYVWDQVHGVTLDRPLKKDDDFFDALKYAVLPNFVK